MYSDKILEVLPKRSLPSYKDNLGIEQQRLRHYEGTDYPCASCVKILKVSRVGGVEFESAVMRVDFEEIEVVKQSTEKWLNQKVSMTAKTS
jgi:hypothetical protein